MNSGIAAILFGLSTSAGHIDLPQGRLILGRFWMASVLCVFVASSFKKSIARGVVVRFRLNAGYSFGAPMHWCFSRPLKIRLQRPRAADFT